MISARRIQRTFRQSLATLILALDPGACALAAEEIRERETAAGAVSPLQAEEVVRSVLTQYPPYLAALIERDVVSGRLRSAEAIFDFNLLSKVLTVPSGFYESTTLGAGFEQFLGMGGATLFGGYQRTSGALPDYYRSRRTDDGGTFSAGVRLPLLQDGSIDKKRADLMKARLAKEAVEPDIQAMQLAYAEMALLAYFQWVSTGQRLRLEEQLLQLAQDRAQAISRQISEGLLPAVREMENRQMIASREISVIKAKREFDLADVGLSLFLRDQADDPVRPGMARLPERFPDVSSQGVDPLRATRRALDLRPELTSFDFELARLNIDARLYRNQLLPQLDATAAVEQSIGAPLYKDTGNLEVKLGLEFKMPLQRNAARGALEENRGKIEQIRLKAKFAAERIEAQTVNATTVLAAAYDQIQRAVINTRLAENLREAEADKFELGATDLLSLQWRERQAYDAAIGEIESRESYFKAWARVLTSTGLLLEGGKESMIQLEGMLDSLRWNPTP